jgi:hypothetical protein
MSTSTLSVRAPARLERSIRASLAALLVTTATIGPPRIAHAAGPSADAIAALELNEMGSSLYASGNYAAALDSFERAYTLIAEPNLLFNIAGCHERLGHKSQAVEYYRWFLGSSATNTNGRRRAIAAIARLTDTPPPAPKPTVVEKNGWDDTVWPIATLGAGILFAGLGAGLYLDGAHDHNEVTNAPGFGEGSSTLTDDEAKELIDAGDTKKLVGGIAFGFGAALIATHVAITVWRSTSHDESGQTTGSTELRLIPGGWALAGAF